MAVTIIREPLSLVPAYNDIEYYASTSLPVTGDFNFYVTVAISGDNYIYRVPAEDTNKCYFNLRNVAEKYMANYYPFGVLGWTAVTDGYKTATVNIGEEVNGVVTSGTNKTARFWNGALNSDERRNYAPADYALGSDIIWLNNLDVYTNFNTPAKTIRRDQDLTFYFLNDPGSGNRIDRVQVACVYIDESGSPASINGFDISNALTDEYIAINLSPRAVNALEVASPGTCVGSLYATPFGNGENAITFTFIDSAAAFTKICYVRIDEDCTNPQYEEKWLFYQNRKGAFDSIRMYGYHKTNVDISKEFYRATPQRFQGSYLASSTPTNGANPIEITSRVLNSSFEKTYTLVSGWLTQDEIDNLEDLYTGSFAFIQRGFQDYQKVQVVDRRYEIKKKSIEKLVQVFITVTTGQTERRQFE